MNSNLVLVADDHVDSADMLATLIRLTTGAPTLAAYDGRAAVEVCMAERPLVVLLDIDMPVVNGIEAAAAIRKAAHPPALLICVSGNLELIVGSEAASLFDHALSKPVDVDRLSEIVLAALSQNVYEHGVAATTR